MSDPNQNITEYDPWQDNAEAHEVLNQCVQGLAERLGEVTKYVNDLATPEKILYKPKGAEEYLNIKENYDEIYRRLEELEAMAHKAPSTDHGKRLTALEEKINGL
tara:strand:- start:49648 stop:49962 length:315 start_codon:yes stop_codon:yes gene_type:complete